MHSSTSTTDQYYANHSDQELKNKLDKIGKSSRVIDENDEDFKEFLRFKAWKQAQKEGL